MRRGVVTCSTGLCPGAWFGPPLTHWDLRGLRFMMESCFWSLVGSGTHRSMQANQSE